MAVPLPRLAIVTADGTHHLLDGSLASMIEWLLEERKLIETCGDKVRVKIDCAGGYSTGAITKPGIRHKKSA